jgi:hypothetical protein
MKKPLKIVIIVVAIILALPVINLIRWTFQAKKPLSLIIMDKTVPNLERDNHRSLIWVLTNGRFVKKWTLANGKLVDKNTYSSYPYKKDYYGFYPSRPLRERKWSTQTLRLPDIFEVVPKVDGLYYTDTYGVYFNDWYKGINESRRSRKLYGGMLFSDYMYCVEMQRNNKLVILEYNTFDYPTAELERAKTQDSLLRIKCSGWTGKYFSTLDSAKAGTNLPSWITAMYRKQYKLHWNFTRAGVILITDKKIIVLEEGTHLKSALPLISTDSTYREKYGITNNIAFQGWIDIVDPLKTKVISKFNLSTTSVGDSLLFDNFLTNSFPAVITDTKNQRTYYFAGDFANNKVSYWTSRFKGIEKLKGILYSDKPQDPRNFFWCYYKPMLNGILNDYYNAIKTK